MDSVQDFPRDRAMPSRPVYQIHPSWAVNGGLIAVTLCFRPQGHGGRVGRSPFREVWWMCQFTLLCLEGLLKGRSE